MEGAWQLRIHTRQNSFIPAERTACMKVQRRERAQLVLKRVYSDQRDGQICGRKREEAGKVFGWEEEKKPFVKGPMCLAKGVRTPPAKLVVTIMELQQEGVTQSPLGRPQGQSFKEWIGGEQALR